MIHGRCYFPSRINFLPGVRMNPGLSEVLGVIVTNEVKSVASNQNVPMKLLILLILQLAPLLRTSLERS